jgi:anti-anti-sigma regulatory factor
MTIARVRATGGCRCDPGRIERTDQRDGDRVVLDLSAVDFMDTSALAVVVSHWRRQVDAGGMFLLAGARYRYTKALWITGLADRLPLYDSVDDAVAAAQPEPGTGPATGTGPPG